MAGEGGYRDRRKKADMEAVRKTWRQKEDKKARNKT